MLESYWSCAKTYPCHEKSALSHLRSQSYEAFFPYFISRDRHKNIQVTPIFPGYLFIRIFPEQSWAAINSTIGIQRLLTFCGSDTPCKIPEDFIDSMKRGIIARPRSEYTPIKPDLPKEGDRVKITGGAFADREAIVKWSSQQRIALLLSLLGRQVEIKVASSSISRLIKFDGLSQNSALAGSL